MRITAKCVVFSVFVGFLDVIARVVKSVICFFAFGSNGEIGLGCFCHIGFFTKLGAVGTGYVGFYNGLPT